METKVMSDSRLALRQRGTRDNPVYGTDDELWYLERAGLHSIPVRYWPAAIEEMQWTKRYHIIHTYECGMKHRKRWGDINNDIIAEYTAYELDRLRTERTPWELSVIDLLDLSNPVEDYLHMLTETQKKALVTLN